MAAVVGQLARDLVLPVDQVPAAGTQSDATDRFEQFGGKGANQAVALAQLGVRPRLVAVASDGDDVIGTWCSIRRAGTGSMSARRSDARTP